ncbi:MAG: phosphatidylglycerophosphatase A [Ignavibacteria bacterium]|jgi:phosphatidylglycerophosphatase A|nr:phosphatidylglycerophosphatase A [Ignavibacteria bacterium]MCU7505097.1 phosphatidylglycerophosphatase A [Ignavibacteria bacterium]MCU7518071.1 phosphatidylglycerophosphatase A [Ignavibacteria bacterium]
MKNNFFLKILGSGFYTGYIPFAPGTFASLAALILYYLIPGFELPYVLIPMIVVFAAIGIKAGDRFEIMYGKKDPSQCTIDEVVGMWISLLFLPKRLNYVILSFIIWRIFDIIKPSPARNAEKLPGGLGIMLDDIIAAVYSCILVHLIIFLF